MHTSSAGLLRHISRCNDAVLPGTRVALRVRTVAGPQLIGWPGAALAAVLAAFNEIERGPEGLTLNDGRALYEISRIVSERGLHRWRGETFDVRADPDGKVLAQIDRGGLPAFGIEAGGVHVNGLVDRPDGLWLWVAKRAADKALDPGKLDHIVAGGIPAGLGPEQTLIKEAAEEAAIPAELARQAVPVASIHYAMERPEGLRRDRLRCYDLRLPAGFTPVANDGEVAGFELWPLQRAVAAVRDTDAFKFNVALVLIDLFLRTGAVAGAEAGALQDAMAPLRAPL